MFALFFFIVVEVPSMIVMAVHKGIMIASGRGSTGRPLPVWAYRIIGVVVVPLAVMTALVVGLALHGGGPGSPTQTGADVAVDRYLQATLVARDANQAKQFVCESADLTEIDAWRDDLAKRERDFGVRIAVSWGAATVSQRAAEATVSLPIVVEAGTGGVVQSRLSREYRFTVVHQDGWRVCAAHAYPQ